MAAQMIVQMIVQMIAQMAAPTVAWTNARRPTVRTTIASPSRNVPFLRFPYPHALTTGNMRIPPLVRTVPEQFPA